MPISEKYAHLLIEAINATGGVVQFSDGTVAPACDPDWIDLGEAYLAACAEMQCVPKFDPAEEPDKPEPVLTDTSYRVTRGEVRTLLIASVDHLTRADERALTRDGYRRGEYGWLLPIRQDSWPIPETVPPSPGLAGAMEYARIHGCAYLLLGDGPVLPGVPTSGG